MYLTRITSENLSVNYFIDDAVYYGHLGQVLWDVCVKIYQFFCSLFCMDTTPDPSLQAFYGRDTQFTILERVSGVDTPTKVACTVMATEAAYQYLQGGLRERSSADWVLVKGGLRMLDALHLSDVTEDVYTGISRLGVGGGKQLLQDSFARAVEVNPALSKQRVRVHGMPSRYLTADAPELIRAFHGKIKTGIDLITSQDESYLDEMTEHLTGMTDRAASKENSVRKYSTALQHFIAFHRKADGSFKEKIAGVVTAGQKSYMIGLSLNKDGEVVESSLFDSHGHPFLTFWGGAVLKTWHTDPLGELSTYLASLTSPRFQITPVGLGESPLSNDSV